MAASIVCSPHSARQPLPRASRLRSGAFSNEVPEPALPRVAKALGDRMPGAVADLEEALLRGAAAARQAVAAVLPRELDTELLEPVDRARRLAGEDLDELAVRRLVRGAPDVLCVLLGRVLGAEGGLDPALGLGGVVRLERALGRDRDPRSGALGGHGGGKARGPAADHKHVESVPLGHLARLAEIG